MAGNSKKVQTQENDLVIVSHSIISILQILNIKCFN